MFISRAVATLVLTLTTFPLCVCAAAGDITLLGSISLPNSVFMSDVWGYVDPVTMHEYAVVGDWDGRKVYIVDATDPASMKIASEVSSVSSFDLKVWGHYLYTCDGTASGLNSWVIDLTDPNNPVVGDYTFQSAHNISISSGGIMYLEHNRGLHTFDLNPNPLRPTEISYQSRSDGHDSTPRGNLLYDFGGYEGTFIWDVTDPAAPVQLGHISDPEIVYHHSGDATTDGNFIFINDELGTHPTPDITVWDISDPAAAVKVGAISDARSTVHNCYVVGDLLYVSYYAAGFKVFDITTPSSPVLTDQYDTSALNREGYVGAFGVYPYAPGNRVYVSDIDNGLFVFNVPNTPTTTRSTGKGTNRGDLTLAQNNPNPFNPFTTISYELPGDGHVVIDIFSARGQLVRHLVDGQRPAGPNAVTWNGTSDSGQPLGTGVYFYRLEHAGSALTRRMLLLK